MASILARGVLAQIALEGGRIDAAEASAGEGLALISRLGLGENAASASVGTAVACLGARSGDVSRARVHLEQGRSLLPRLAAAPWLSIRTRAARPGRAHARRSPTGGIVAGRGSTGARRLPDAGVLPRLLVRQERALEEARGGGGLLGQPLTAAECRCWSCCHPPVPAEIGEALHISRNTVKAHLKAIYRKLEVTRRSDAIERARRLGLLDPLG